MLGCGITLCDAIKEKDVEVLLSAGDASSGQVIVERRYIQESTRNSCWPCGEDRPQIARPIGEFGASGNQLARTACAASKADLSGRLVYRLMASQILPTSSRLQPNQSARDGSQTASHLRKEGSQAELKAFPRNRAESFVSFSQMPYYLH